MKSKRLQCSAVVKAAHHHGRNCKRRGMVYRQDAWWCTLHTPYEVVGVVVALQYAGKMCTAMDRLVAACGRNGRGKFDGDPKLAGAALTDLLTARRDYDRAIEEITRRKP